MVLYVAIELLGGRCVRPYLDTAGRTGMVQEDALAVAHRWQEAGAHWLHVVDLDGARDGKPGQGELVRAIANATGLPFQFAGGLRTEQDVAQIFEQGATRAVLDTAAAHDAELLNACLARWPGRIAVSLEARGEAVTVAGWLASTSETIADFAQRIVAAGVSTLLMADVERDGSLASGVGPRLLRLRSALPDVTLIASGAIMSLDDVRRLARAGMDGAVLGRALYEGRLDLAEAMGAAEDAARDPASSRSLAETKERTAQHSAGVPEARAREHAENSTSGDEPLPADKQ